MRPETVDLERAANGAETEGSVAGEVVSHTFLGAVTRIRIDDGSGGRGLTADVSTSKAARIEVGSRVVARFPAESARLLSLADEALPVIDPDDQ